MSCSTYHYPAFSSVPLDNSDLPINHLGTIKIHPHLSLPTQRGMQDLQHELAMKRTALFSTSHLHAHAIDPTPLPIHSDNTASQSLIQTASPNTQMDPMSNKRYQFYLITTSCPLSSSLSLSSPIHPSLSRATVVEETSTRESVTRQESPLQRIEREREEGDTARRRSRGTKERKRKGRQKGRIQGTRRDDDDDDTGSNSSWVQRGRERERYFANSS